MLIWEEWEDTYILFHRGTGETHLLNEMPAEILRMLQYPRRLDDLSVELARLAEAEDNPSWRRKILHVLEELESLSLVERTAA
jgi:PqqD family protein of HPr-rel-A system